jgi:hypothetical protein
VGDGHEVVGRIVELRADEAEFLGKIDSGGLCWALIDEPSLHHKDELIKEGEYL